MTRTTIAGVTLLLTLSSSLAYGFANRHVAWEALVQGKDGSKIRGPATMEAGMAAGTVDVVVNYTGDVAGVVRPWHVHIGSCAKGGAVFGDRTAYTPLKVSADGKAEGKAVLRIALPESGEYYVNIHESAANMGKIVACGDLMLED